VIRTFYLSNGDAEQVTNVVRTMIEARNVFPLKALNAITIRDTADKVRIAEKIIEANDKAKAEVVVQVELVQLDLSRIRELGMAVSGFRDSEGNTSSSANASPIVGGSVFTGGTLDQIRKAVGSLGALRGNMNFSIPTVTYSLLKTYGNSELLRIPSCISEARKPRCTSASASRPGHDDLGLQHDHDEHGLEPRRAVHVVSVSGRRHQGRHGAARAPQPRGHAQAHGRSPEPGPAGDVRRTGAAGSRRARSSRPSASRTARPTSSPASFSRTRSRAPRRRRSSATSL
jgi:hypothetical protein